MWFIICSAVLVIVTSFYLYFIWRSGELELLGIPHIKPKFLLGNFGDAKNFQQIDIETRKKIGKVYGFMEARTPTIVVGDPDIIKNILVKDFSNFIDHRPQLFRGIMNHDILSAKGDNWRQMRAIITPALSSGKIKKMVPVIIECAKVAASRSEITADEFEAKDFCMKMSTDVMCQVLFGFAVNEEQLPNVVKKFRNFMKVELSHPLVMLLFFMPDVAAMVHNLFPNLYFWGRKGYKFFNEIVEECYLTRARDYVHDRVDVLQIMIEAEKLRTESGDRSKGLSKTQLISNALTLLVAALDTSSTTVQFFMYLMAVNPEIQDKLAEEIENVVPDLENLKYEDLSDLKYLTMCLEETMRIFPALLRTERQAVEGISYGSLRIPKGYVVSLPIRGLHHDPEFWPDPDKFDPERFSDDAKAKQHPYAYLAFGLGPRSCPGNRLALVFLKISIVILFKKYKFNPCPNTQIPIQLKPSFLPIPEKGIFLKTSLR